MRSVVILTASLAFASGVAADAAQIVFFGEDLASGSFSSADGAAAVARDEFLSSVNSGVGTEDFESFGGGENAPLSLDFAGSAGTISATLSGGASAVRAGPAEGAFNTTPGGGRYLLSGGGDMVIDFDTPVSVFGFFATGLGNLQNDLVLTREDGTAETLSVGLTAQPDGGAGASVLFFGFVDPFSTYTSIMFRNSGSGALQLGFDDMTVGDRDQVIDPGGIPPGAVPLPAPALLLLSGLAVLAAVRRPN